MHAAVSRGETLERRGGGGIVTVPVWVVFAPLRFSPEVDLLTYDCVTLRQEVR